MKKTSTFKALLMSVLSLMLCCSMLVGTTFAWFTDEVVSGVNTIHAGNLDVDVYYGDPVQKNSIEGISTLFNAVTLWEPGAVAYENLTVANLGTLALKYQMSIGFANENYIMEDGTATYGLSDILKVAVVEGGVDETLTRDELVASIPESDWTAMEDFTIDGELLANTNEEPVGIVIWWQPSDADNNWNLNNGKTLDTGDVLKIDLGVILLATQLTEESDSFDENYDKDATYPAIAVGTLLPGATNGLSLTVGAVTVNVPAGAPAGNYKLDVGKFDISTDDATGDLRADTDIKLMKDGQPADASVSYEVEIDIGIMAQIKKLLHNDTEITAYNYDVFTGIITFNTSSFSPFAVEYDIFATEVTVDKEANRIFSGYFEGVNPAILDTSLQGDDSEYIAVDYVKNGVKYYAVSQRATTVILGDADDGGSSYTFENGNYTVKMIADNKLYAEISALQNNDHSTVYLLPGTYDEATTIYIYSSMDIIGLGKAEDVKVVKGSSSGSNRHLFNASGTKADYIEVSLRNLHLDATAKTTNGKDNAAVQSIRKSKVKCYDLEIVKGTGWDAVAFYVNGNNEVDGVKYPAYLYVEHCNLNTTRTFGVVTTSGSYKFYHTGLTYSGTTYTSNSGSIKNVPMAWDDWDW